MDRMVYTSNKNMTSMASNITSKNLVKFKMIRLDLKPVPPKGGNRNGINSKVDFFKFKSTR